MDCIRAGVGLDWNPLAMEASGVPPARQLARSLQNRGIGPRIAGAFERVPRHLFVPENLRACSYEDRALPIGSGQTISQPYMIALMLRALDPGPGERVLEIGTGSGYETALLSLLAREVFTMERIAALQERARAVLEELGIRNVRYRVGDGTLGWPEQAPFDGIIVSAAAPELPRTLAGQLSGTGRLVVPVGRGKVQKLVRAYRADGTLRREELGECAFVPLIGKEGFGGQAG